MRSLTLEGIEPVCLAWSPNGERLAVGEANGTVRIWDTKSWRPLSRGSSIVPKDKETNQADTLAWNPDGRRLAVSRAWIPRLDLLDTGTGTLSIVDRNPVPFTMLAWSPDGRMLAGYGWEENCVWRFGRNSGKLLLAGGSRTLAWSKPTMVSGLREDQLLTWDLSLGRWEPVRKP
jgi:WD40 repeat protein